MKCHLARRAQLFVCILNKNIQKSVTFREAILWVFVYDFTIYYHENIKNTYLGTHFVLHFFLFLLLHIVFGPVLHC